MLPTPMIPPVRRGRFGAGRIFLMLAALLCTPSAFATAYVRFANVSLQGQPASDTVQIKLNGVVLVESLGYKAASDYHDVESGTPILSVWFQGTQIVERQLDIRDDRSYLYIVIGNGSNAAFNVHVEHEQVLRLDESRDFTNAVMAAPYPGHPHQDNRPATGFGFRNTCSRSVNGSSTRISMPFNFSGGHFPPHLESEKYIPPPVVVPGERLPVGTCKADIYVGAFPGGIASPFPPGLIRPDVSYAIASAAYTTLILVGDGQTTPIEWWVLQKRARFVDPYPIEPGSWAAGIWSAPDVPGLSIALDMDSLPGEQKLAGLLFGNDIHGKARWYRLNATFFSPGDTAIEFYPSEYQSNVAAQVNEGGNSSAFELRFLGCDRARLSLRSSFGIGLIDIAAFGQNNRPIELERVTPLAENCPH